MKHTEIRIKIKEFMQKRSFAVLSSASLVPENDPSVLFTTAGVQPLVPYVKGQKHPLGNKISNIQKCIRTQDIEEIGDATHDTFFEMIGYWYLGTKSIGDFETIKKAGVSTSYDLYFTSEGFDFDIKKTYVTCFAGNKDVPKDTETAGYWIELGVPENRIYFLKNNWWSTGETGPCGPDTELFYPIDGNDLGNLTLKEYLEADTAQKIVEIGNTVFMLYNKTENSLEDLAQQNVDMGGGFERVAMASQNVSSIFETDLFLPVYTYIQSHSTVDNAKAMRIVADHLRTSVLILSEHVTPSNTAQGYILRRLIRRLYRFATVLGLDVNNLEDAVSKIFEIYEDVYQLSSQKDFILEELKKEILKFEKTLHSGIHTFEKIINNRTITSKDIFNLYSTYGFPLELTYELLDEKGIQYNKEAIELEIQEHKSISKTAAQGMFKGGLAGNSEIETKYHTVTHILHTVLRNMFGIEVVQRGSNITTERMRFDFLFPRALTSNEVKSIEENVNEIIQKDLSVIRHDVTYEEAKKMNAIGLFENKYGEKVSVYQIGQNNEPFSIEICMGPHVEHTKMLGTFKITKEESSSSGVRRIKAILENE